MVVVLRGAGGYQALSDLQNQILHPDKNIRVDPSKGFVLGPKPYGDNPEDQPPIVDGINRERRWRGR